MDAPATTDVVDLDSPEERHRSLRRAAYLTAGVGIAHALLFLLAFWLLFSVPRGSGSEEITDIYRRRLTLSGLYLMPFAGIAFIWFSVALRMWTSGHVRRENVLLSNVQLVSGILYVGLFFAAGAAAAATAASAEFEGAQAPTALIDELPKYAGTLIFVFAVRMAAMFVFTTTNIARSAHILPRWFVLVGYVVGLFLLLSASFSKALVLVFPIWVLVLCVILLWWARTIPAGATVPLTNAQAAAVLGRGGGES